MQAQLALFAGKHAANIAGIIHEKQGSYNNQPKEEEQMDLWNNEQEREIAKEIIWEYGTSATIPSTKVNDIIARKVVERMQAGKLILSPSGKRCPTKKLNIQKYNLIKSTSESPNCVGSYKVSEYTKKDGTHVNSYTRTCRAKHTSINEDKTLKMKEKYSNKKFQDIAAEALEYVISLFI